MERVGDALDIQRRHYAFAGNMANNLYMRAKGMAARPVDITIHPHPQDRYLMSHPAWEEYAGDLARPEIDSVDKALAAGMELPHVDCLRAQSTLEAPPGETGLPEAVRLLDFKRWPGWFTYLPTIESLSDADAVLAVQVPYLAYLTGRPYVATQMGGDIWYEASRDDEYGRLQRRAFQQADAIIVSNPWSAAFARRYGLRNMIYLPFLLDDEKYSPGPPDCRADWAAATGGEFFVLMTSRLDYLFKGSDVALRGFARFSVAFPQARLVITGWGADQHKAAGLFAELGIADKVHVIPVVGKRRVVSYLRSADCVLDQLSIGYYGAAALEAFACGRPVVMNLNKVQYEALLPEGCAPVCQAVTEIDVEEQLRGLASSPGLAEERGQQLRGWFLQTHGSRKWARIYDAVLAGSALRCLPEFRGSPLSRPYEDQELSYHTAELAAAPVFPNYF